MSPGSEHASGSSSKASPHQLPLCYPARLQILLRDELSKARDLDGRLRRGPGRRPDGVLVRASGQAEAVEVELTPKRDRTEYDHKLAWYQGQLDFQVVHWFVPSLTLRERLLRISYELQLDDLVRVAPLPPGLDYLPGIKADRRPSRPSTFGHPYRSHRYAVEPRSDTARSLRSKHS